MGASPTHLTNASDARAGSWAFQYAMATDMVEALPAIAPAVKDILKGLSCSKIVASRDQLLIDVGKASGLETDQAEKFRKAVSTGFSVYERLRTENDLWKRCEGKQVLALVHQVCGFASVATYQAATFAFWTKTPSGVPQEVLELRKYISAL